MKNATPTSNSSNSGKNSLITGLLLAIVAGGLALLFWPQKSPPPAPPTTPPATTPTESVEAVNAPLDFKPVLGNWLREDGGYRLELTPSPNGSKLQAAYFNPRPINVSFASATNEANSLKLRVELNDTGYPGCVYSLVHDRVNDRLVGTYFQAAMGETYEVMFVRVP